jgi:hypothetical protein
MNDIHQMIGMRFEVSARQLGSHAQRKRRKFRRSDLIEAIERARHRVQNLIQYDNTLIELLQPGSDLAMRRR